MRGPPNLAASVPGIEAAFRRDLADAIRAKMSDLAIKRHGGRAAAEGEVSVILGDETYRHAASQIDAGSGTAGIEALQRRAARVVASSFIPDAASNVQTAFLHAGTDMARGDSNRGGVEWRRRGHSQSLLRERQGQNALEVDHALGFVRGIPRRGLQARGLQARLKGEVTAFMQARESDLQADSEAASQRIERLAGKVREALADKGVAEVLRRIGAA